MENKLEFFFNKLGFDNNITTIDRLKLCWIFCMMSINILWIYSQIYILGVILLCMAYVLQLFQYKYGDIEDKIIFIVCNFILLPIMFIIMFGI